MIDRQLEHGKKEEIISSIESVAGTFTVYNMEIANTHVYYAKDILGHNAVAIRTKI